MPKHNPNKTLPARGYAIPMALVRRKSKAQVGANVRISGEAMGMIHSQLEAHLVRKMRQAMKYAAAANRKTVQAQHMNMACQ
jgi:histone H3/H4